MATSSWAPAWDQSSQMRSVVVAHSINQVLDRVMRQRVVPMARTRMTEWLLDDVLAVWPGSEGVRWPSDSTDCL